MSSAERRVQLLLVVGLFLFVAVIAVVRVVTPLGMGSALYLAALLVLLPVLAVAQLPAVEGESLPRLPVYVSSAVVILLLGVFGLFLGIRAFGAEAMGLGPARWGEVAIWTVALSTMAMVLVVLVFLARRILGIRETPLLLQLLPQTVGEKAVFVGLSLAAGVGEELAYRGFLLPALTVLVGGEWGAVGLSSVVFGVLHAYQGWLGILRTAMLGLLLAGGFLISGSLWPAIFAHAILDLLAGLVIGEALVKD